MADPREVIYFALYCCDDDHDKKQCGVKRVYLAISHEPQSVERSQDRNLGQELKQKP